MSIKVVGHTIGHVINSDSCTTSLFEEGGGKLIATFSGKTRDECLAQVASWAKVKKLETVKVEPVRLPPSQAVQEKEQAEKLRKAQEAAVLSADDLAGGNKASLEEVAKLEAEAAAAKKKAEAEEAKAKAKEDAEIAAEAKAEAAAAKK